MTPRPADFIRKWSDSTLRERQGSQEHFLRMGTWLGTGNDPRYTLHHLRDLPLPRGLHARHPRPRLRRRPPRPAHRAAAAELDRLREAWLNPADLVRREPEVVPGYPDRLLSVDAAAAKVLRTRTLTNLYNARPAWLAGAHRALDEAVASAYGWPTDLASDDILARLFILNQDRAAKGR